MEAPRKALEGLGLKPGGLPGVVIPFAVFSAALAPFREGLFGSVGAPGVPEVLVGALAAFAVMFNKVIADALLDRMYDHFYGESFGEWESTTSSVWLFFPRGHDLQDARSRTRRYFIENKKDKDYGAKDQRGRFIETIYRPVIHDLENGDPAIYRAIEAELSWSKTARNSIVPLSLLALSTLATQGPRTLAAGLLGLAAILVVPFFSLRYMHQLHLYHRFCAKHAA